MIDEIKEMQEQLLKMTKKLSKLENFTHDDFDFNETKTDDDSKKRQEVVDDNGILDFASMKLDPTRSIEERQSLKWRRSCEYWFKRFQDMGQPICAWFSMHDQPNMADTVFITDVGQEMVEIIKIIAADIRERSWRFNYIYGLSIPDNRYRKRAKKRMHEYYGVSPDDTQEFLKFRETSLRAARQPVTTTPKKAPSVTIGRLSKENIGERYERQLEWHFNIEGYHVESHGLRQKENDGGVDHILVKNGKVDLVQAKAISKGTKISPYEAEAMYNRMQDFWKKNKSNTELLCGDLDRIMLVVANGESIPTETQEHAKKVGLVFKIVPYKDKWPDVKCVVSGKGEKRYYRPTDQHWLGCNMLADKRRFWVHSAEEAQAKGHKPTRYKRFGK